jgi:hypothetical protein
MLGSLPAIGFTARATTLSAILEENTEFSAFAGI